MRELSEEERVKVFFEEKMEYEIEFADYLFSRIEELTEKEVLEKVEKIYDDAIYFDFEYCLTHSNTNGDWYDIPEQTRENIKETVEKDLEANGWESFSTSNFGGHEYYYKINE